MKVGDRVKLTPSDTPLYGTIIGPCWIGNAGCWRVKWDESKDKYGYVDNTWDEMETHLTVVETNAD